MIRDKKLYLSLTDRKISGVCGGIADYIGMDSTIIRLLWTVVTLFTGVLPGVVLYIIAIVVMPKPPMT